MLVIMEASCNDVDVERVVSFLHYYQLTCSPSRGPVYTVIRVVGTLELARSQTPSGGNLFEMLSKTLQTFPSVIEVKNVTRPYQRASREFHPEDTIIEVPAPCAVGHIISIGSSPLVMMAGPCTVENEKQLMMAAHAAHEGGAVILRGGAFKPSTSPYGFRGMGKPGLVLLAKARAEFGMAVITEVMTPEDVPLVSEYADILQIGTRSMQNFALLEAVGRGKKPVLLKRGMAATIEEWLLAAEYILLEGNQQVILCERGIRTFEKLTRNTLDISAIPLTKQLSHLPIIVDPSQGTGKRDLVPPLSLAAIAAGCDGLLVEIHPDPDHALKDGAQSLTLEQFEAFMPQAQSIARSIGRTFIFPSRSSAPPDLSLLPYENVSIEREKTSAL